MRRVARAATLVAVGMVLATMVVSWGSAEAGNSSSGRAATSPLGRTSGPAKGATVSGTEKLAVSLVSQGSDLVPVGAGFQPIEASPITVKCPAASCTIEAEQNLQVSNTIAGNRWAICTAVDGNFMSGPFCPYLGVLPSDGSYVSNSFSQTQSGITNGTHTVQTWVYSDFGLNRSIYEITYRFYTP